MAQPPLSLRILKLAQEHEDLRPHLLPLVMKHARSALSGLTTGLGQIEGVKNVKVLKTVESHDEGLNAVLALYLDPEIGANKGRQFLSSLVRRQLERVLSANKASTIRLLPPAPGLDPYGRPGVTWTTSRELYEQYYGRNPYKLIVHVGGNRK